MNAARSVIEALDGLPVPDHGQPITNREFADALQAITRGRRLDLLPGREDGPGDDTYLDITRSPRTPASSRRSTSPRRSPTMSRGVPTTPAEGAHHA